jgi:hypothetical protein
MRRERRTDGQADGREDGQTDRHDEANSRFRNFANAPKKSLLSIFLLNTSKDEINVRVYPVRMHFLPSTGVVLVIRQPVNDARKITVVSF